MRDYRTAASNSRCDGCQRPIERTTIHNPSLLSSTYRHWAPEPADEPRLSLSSDCRSSSMRRSNWTPSIVPNGDDARLRLARSRRRENRPRSGHLRPGSLPSTPRNTGLKMSLRMWPWSRAPRRPVQSGNFTRKARRTKSTGLMSWDVAFDEPIDLPNGKGGNQPAGNYEGRRTSLWPGSACGFGV